MTKIAAAYTINSIEEYDKILLELAKGNDPFEAKDEDIVNLLKNKGFAYFVKFIFTSGSIYYMATSEERYGQFLKDYSTLDKYSIKSFWGDRRNINKFKKLIKITI